jgi:hypothetical protein
MQNSIGGTDADVIQCSLIQKEERTCSCRHRAAPSCGQWGYSLGQELAAGELGQVEARQELARQEADMEPLECQQLLLGLEGMQGPAPQAPSSA